MRVSTSALRQRFLAQGWVKVPNGISQPLIDPVRREANIVYGSNYKQALHVIRSSADSVRYRKEMEEEGEKLFDSYHTAVAAEKTAAADSLAEAVLPFAEMFLGEGRAVPLTRQITWASPRKLGTEAEMAWYGGSAVPHLDFLRRFCKMGLSAHWPLFSLIVGVNLTATAENEGDLLVYSGAHRTVSQYLADHCVPGTKGADKAMIDLSNMDLRTLSLPKVATHIVGNPGDVIIMHPLLPHDIGPNYGIEPRLKMYFRFESLKFIAANRTIDSLLGEDEDEPKLAVKPKRFRR